MTTHSLPTSRTRNGTRGMGPWAALIAAVLLLPACGHGSGGAVTGAVVGGIVGAGVGAAVGDAADRGHCHSCGPYHYKAGPAEYDSAW